MPLSFLLSPPPHVILSIRAADREGSVLLFDSQAMICLKRRPNKGNDTSAALQGRDTCQEIDPLQFVQGTFFTNGKGNRACSSRAICCVPDQQPPEGFSLDRRCLTGYTALSEGRMIRSFLPIPSRPSPVKRQPVKYRMSRPAGKSMISLLFLL